MNALLLISVLLTAADGAAFTTYLDTPFPPADGFSAPFGARCEGNGPVKAVAAGRVVRSDRAVVVEHVTYENHLRKILRSTIAPMQRVDVKPGDVVQRGQLLGTAQASGELAITGTARPCQFIAERAQLFVPQREPFLILVDHASHRLRMYKDGEELAEYAIGFGQAVGGKEQRGDNRTPKGMYFVAAKSQGPFTGPAAAYFGGHWVKVNYPNAYDAERGAREGWITRAQAATIRDLWRARKLTNERTKLGGGIGFHAWAHEWSEETDGRQLSWGCVVLHVRDIADFYARVPVGTMVVAF
jgi:lipoprotein-anchoring transpeptidase ErfK/SrfK